jgi:BASS family bile acid:Na+ symporter
MLANKDHLLAATAMLAFLLFNAGLGVRTKELAGLLRNPSLLLVGALGNLFVPLAFVVGVNITMKLWHNSDEVQQILTGLALVASMPIAGASTAWAQNANGNLAVSLGLILLTTLCSPVLTPIVLDTVGFVTTGDYSEDLHELAANGAGGFLAVWVILPSLLSMLTHWILGEKRTALISPYLKLSNFGVLALLNYSNASISLPGVLSQPDPDFVLVMLIVVILLCFAMFGAGYLVSRAFGAHRLQFDIYGIMSFMNEDDRDLTDLDPANLVPLECVFEPENPAIRIPSTYIPSEPLAPVDNDVLFI